MNLAVCTLCYLCEMQLRDLVTVKTPVALVTVAASLDTRMRTKDTPKPLGRLLHSVRSINPLTVESYDKLGQHSYWQGLHWY